jgi:hypothetical protein
MRNPIFFITVCMLLTVVCSSQSSLAKKFNARPELISSGVKVDSILLDTEGRMMKRQESMKKEGTPAYRRRVYPALCGTTENGPKHNNTIILYYLF